MDTQSSAMDGIRTYLESTTVHGLTYISTTRKYARLFWILTVISGFLGAGYLIKESFDGWDESPVKTTIETLPISEITFPKVTVCPPKNTFTDLNYDLMMTENRTLTEEIRDEMFKYALEVINEDGYSGSDWIKLHEKDRFYNWYHGYTHLDSPVYSRHGLNIHIFTAAASGVVTTQYYGEQYKPELVERKLWYQVNINPPRSVRGNKNVTLHYKLEKVSMTELAKGSEDGVWMSGYIDYLEADLTTVYKNVTPPGYGYYFIALSRHVSSEDVETQKLDLMPGFRFSWWYTGAEVTSDNRFKDDDDYSDYYSDNDNDISIEFFR